MPTPSTSSYASPSSGFHPDFVTEIMYLRPLGAEPSSSTSSSSDATCNLHLLYTLDNTVILDQYQLGQLHSEGRLITSKKSSFAAESSDNTKSKSKGVPIHAEMYLGGQMDLEAPVSALRDANNGDSSKYAIAFLSIPMASSSSSSSNDTDKLPPGYEIPSVDVTVSLPVHLRYQEPVLSRYLSEKGRAGYGGGWWNKNPQLGREDIVDVDLTWPCVFWACDEEPSDVLKDNSPYRKMEASSSCIGLVPQELRSSVPSTSPLHPSTSFPHHYLLPFDDGAPSTSSALADSTTLAGKSIVRVPTGVLGDLQIVSIVNLAATWIGVALIARQAWKVSRKWKDENKLRELKAKTKEKKSL